VKGQSFQAEINTQVWKPFIQTYNTRDTDGFMAVHSKDVVRSPRDSKKLLNWDEYYQLQRQGDNQEKNAGDKRQLELRFTERIANNSLAVEVGVYKVTVKNKEGTHRAFYGRFHVVLRKENNIWKILVDTDSSEENTIDEQDFRNAQPLE
jgi:ketosteroid isomerase-like protein